MYRGLWRGLKVAVKMFSLMEYQSEEEIQQDLENEARALVKVRHAHVVAFYGMGHTTEHVAFIVTELMELGTLTSVLRLCELDWDTKKKFALETALGMAFIHSQGCIHRDLKGGNVLVTGRRGDLRNCTAKVADFGTLSSKQSAKPGALVSGDRAPRAAPPGTSDNTKMTGWKGLVGTLLWMAPEILDGKKYVLSADVYSFGIVMWEIAAQDEPWQDVKGNFLADKLLRLIQMGTRPPVEAAWPADYRDCMCACWQTQPTARPSFARIVAMLQPVTSTAVTEQALASLSEQDIVHVASIDHSTV